MAISWLMVLLAYTHLGGYLRFESFVRVDSGYQIHKLATTLQLRTTLDQPGISGFSALNLIMDRRAPNPVTFRPIELYLTFHRGPVDLTLGKKILTWGAGVFVSPSDFVNPWDFSVMYSDLEEFGEGIEVADFAYYRGNAFVELAFLPMFRPNTYPLPSIQIPVPAGPDTFVVFMDGAHPVLPEPTLKKGEGFLRVGGTWGPMDFRLLAFRGFDRDPDLQVRYVWLPGSNPQEHPPDTIHLRPEYRPVWMGAGTLTWIVGPWELHADVAYVRTEDTDGILPTVKNPYVYGAFGFFRSFWNDQWSLGLDLLVKRIFAFGQTPEDPMGVNALLEEQARMLNFQYEETQPSLAFHLQGSDTRDLWRWSASGIYDLRAREGFLLATLSYAWADGVSLQVGGLFSGRKGRSPFSQMGRHLGQVGFLEARWSF